MNRYLVFAGPNYYPEGGWNDYVGDSDHVLGAQAVGEHAMNLGTVDWVHVVDTTHNRVIRKWHSGMYQPFTEGWTVVDAP